jgi:hypothetical protein
VPHTSKVSSSTPIIGNDSETNLKRSLLGMQSSSSITTNSSSAKTQSQALSKFAEQPMFAFKYRSDNKSKSALDFLQISRISKFRLTAWLEESFGASIDT